MTQQKSHRKVALITGSGKQRVGNAVAEALADRGYDIALHYNRSADDAARSVQRLRAKGVEAEAYQANVADEAAVAQMFAQVADRFGRLDVLVTAAAVWDRIALEETAADDVRRQFEINTLGTFLCCQRAGRLMVAQPEGGVIITIGDWATIRPYLDYAAYFPSKGAILSLTRSFAVELAHRNPAVRVNCILPGPVMLPDGLQPGEKRQAIESTLVKREGRPQHVAHAVLFLVENDFVTGVCLPVDGGKSIAGGESG